jgi:hypothetical protein
VDFYGGLTWLGSKTNLPYSVTWSNPPRGTHSLSAIAADSLGATGLSASVLINVTNLPPQLSLPIGNALSNGAFRLNVDGVPGDTSYLEAGTDLVHWIRIATNTLDGAGHFSFTDTNTAVFPRRFYRALYP